MALFGLVPDIKGEVTLKMSPQDAQREAVGKALSLLGTTIGITGTIMALSANPAIKQQASGAWSRAPKAVQDNKIATMIAVGLLTAAGAYWFINRSVKKQNAERYHGA